MWIVDLQVAVAFLLDLKLGEPRRFPHPVVLIGSAVTFGAGMLRKAGNTPAAQKAAGTLLVSLIVAGTFIPIWLALRLLSSVWPLGSFLLGTFLIYTSLAVCSLQEHVEAVLRPLRAQNLSLARQALSLVVGRDTALLDEGEVIRAAVETTAESTADGIVAPIFYAILGGAPLALAYKAVNTLDSMLGHRDKENIYFGFAAARLDDAANYLPARLTAVLMLLAGFLLKLDTARGWQVMKRDARKHLSPNSGYPEAVAAGLTGAKLGGLNYYRGIPSPRAYLGAEGRTPTLHDLERVLHLSRVTALLSLGIGVLFSLVCRLI